MQQSAYHHFQAAVAGLLLKARLAATAIGVHVASSQGGVGLQVAGQFDDVDLQTFFAQIF